MWFLSPSGWPTYADTDDEAWDLEDRGYQPLDESQVQAAVDAYNAGAPPPPAAVDYVSVAEIGDPGSAASVALRAAFGTPEFLGSNFGFFGDSVTNYGEGYPYYAALLSQGAFRAAQVKSNPGSTSGQLAPLLDAQIIQATPKPTACLVLCGTNDAQTSVPLATYRANIEAMVAALRAANITPVLGTVPPINDDPDAEFARTYNAWLSRYCEVNRIPLVDFHTPLVDQATGNWKAAYGAVDGLHPSNAGNKVMGQSVYDTLKPLLTPRPYLLQPYSGVPNLQANSNFLTDANADGIADNVSVSPSAGLAYGRVSDPAGFYWQRLTLTGAVGRKQLLGAAPTVTSGKIAVGDRLRFAARVRTGQATATGSTTGSTLQITCYKAGYAGVTLNAILTSPAGAMSQQIDGVVSTEIVVPAETEIVQWSHMVGPDDGTYDVAQPTLYNLTALGAE